MAPMEGEAGEGWLEGGEVEVLPQASAPSPAGGRVTVELWRAAVCSNDQAALELLERAVGGAIAAAVAELALSKSVEEARFRARRAFEALLEGVEVEEGEEGAWHEEVGAMWRALEPSVIEAARTYFSVAREYVKEHHLGTLVDISAAYLIVSIFNASEEEGELTMWADLMGVHAPSLKRRLPPHRAMQELRERYCRGEGRLRHEPK